MLDRDKGEKQHTTHRRAEVRRVKTSIVSFCLLDFFVLCFFWGGGRTCWDYARDEEEGKKRTERKGVVVSTQVKHREEKYDLSRRNKE